jgi:hypothetical protein
VRGIRRKNGRRTRVKGGTKRMRKKRRTLEKWRKIRSERYC